MKIAVAKILPLIETIRKSVIDADIVIAAAGIDKETLNYPDNWISLEKYCMLFSESALASGDSLLGLHAGESFTMMSNILGYVMMNCATAGEALSKYLKYQEVTEDIKHFAIYKQNKNLVIEISLKDDTLDKDLHLTDFNLAVFVSYCRSLTGNAVDPLEARFRHPGMFGISEYSRVFKCKLKFQAEKNALVYPAEFGQAPIRQPNRKLLRYFENHLYDLIEIQDKNNSYTVKVRQILAGSIQGDIPVLAEVAKNFSMSARSLQSRLKLEGTTYSAILDSIRKDIALEYLKDGSVSISEISFLLGYSEPSAFHRRFKKWTNATPRALRMKHHDRQGEIRFESLQETFENGLFRPSGEDSR